MTDGEQLDHTPLTFGAFAGQTPSDLAETKRGAKWLVWAFDTVKDKPTCSKALADDCRRDLRKGEDEDD